MTEYVQHRDKLLPVALTIFGLYVTILTCGWLVGSSLF